MNTKFSQVMGGAILMILVAAVGVGCVAEDDPSVAPSFDRMSAPSSGQGTATTRTADNCPTGGGSDLAWPRGVPAGVPLPAGSSIDSNTSVSGIQRVQFELTMSFGDSVRYYLAQLPRHGFTLGAGDSEAAEADIPFQNDSRELSLKLGGLADPCQTEGVLIVGPAKP
jgi:hypothetical protein